jgi:hypothetical protein
MKPIDFILKYSELELLYEHPERFVKNFNVEVVNEEMDFEEFDFVNKNGKLYWEKVNKPLVLFDNTRNDDSFEESLNTPPVYGSCESNESELIILINNIMKMVKN